MKQFLRYTLTLVAILIATSNVWAISNAKVTVISEPSVGGTVAINKSNSATDWGTNKSHQQDGGFFDANKNFTFYRFASAASGYTFKGWSTSQTANSGETNSQFTVRGGLAGTNSYTYYAIFATLQSAAHNTTVQFNDTKVDEQSSKSITIKHSHAGTVSLSLSGTNAGDFSLSENSFTSTSYQEGRNITIYFKPTCVGERTATLTISSNNGLSSITVYLKGNGVRHTPTAITWQEPIDVNMFIGDNRTVNVNSTTDGNITYSSSNSSIISVSGNTLTAQAEGTATITATQAATCKYDAVSITKTFTVNNKKTPTFWLNGDPNQLTDNLKTEDTRSITITNVDANMTATYDQNLLQYTFDGKTATIKALDAGTATIKFVQPETNETFYSDRTFTFHITKYTGTITNNLASSYMVDDVVPESSIYSINNNEVPVQIISSDESVLKFENGQLKAVGAGTATITVKQAETNKWVGISDSKTVTVNKYTLTAHINPTNTVWNATHSNPFSVSITPANGETITDFNVGESSNPAIATYNSSNNTLQTYYTSGDANFTITRDADRKYNALNQTLTLTVNASTESCDINLSATNAETGTGDNSTSGTITLNGEGDILSFSYRLNDNANVAHYLTTQYSTTDTGDNFQDIANSSVGEQDETLLSHSLTLPTGTKRIRFKRTDDGWGTKNFVISNITVTRAQYLRPTDAEGKTLSETNPLPLPTVAINQNCSNTFNLNWSTCSEVKIVSNSDKFTIGTPDNSSKEISLTNPDGNQTFTIYCNTSETGTFEGTITIYDQADKASFNVTATVNNRWTPEMTGAESYSKLVDDTWVADFQFKNTETTTPSADQNAPFYFTIQHTSFVNDESARKPDHTNEVISYDPETYTITAHNAGTAVLTFIQKDTPGYYPASCSCTITVAKHQSNFQMKMDNFTCEIDVVTDETNFFSKEAKNDVDATIDINITEIANDDHPEVLVFDNSTRKFTAASAGRAMVTISQPVHYKWTEYTGTINIEVKKHTPIFTWNDPVYFNQKITDYFTTNNHDTEITISQPSTDEDVAILYFDPENEEDKHTLDLTTYYKETTPLSSTQVTVYQAENWYWYAHTEQHTITPDNQSNHVTFTLTQENYIRDFQVPGGFSDPWADSNGPTWTEGGIHFGQGGIGSGDGGYNWDDKYIIIEFSGIPNKLSFTTTATQPILNMGGSTAGTDNLFFYVSEGTSDTNFTNTWTYTDRDNTITELQLDPNTRFLKLCFTGNLEGWFKDITVTELNQFEFVPNTLDFGEVKITDNTTKTINTTFQYANAGHKINIDLDRTGAWEDDAEYELAKQYITINPTSITDIGGEKVGKTEIQITLHSDDRTPYTIPDGAKIKIWDEAGRCDYLSISGLIEPSEQEIYWSAYFQLEEPIAIPLETGDVKNAATASSNLPITYKTDNPEVIQISDDKSYFTPIAVGDATITAIQDGNQVYDRVESSKKITVTQKMVQIISWPVDFTDLILVENPDPIPLTAATYLLDLVNNRPVFSQEQTDKIEYSVENEEVVKIVDGQLVIVGLGSTTITAAINESEDSHYESTSTTLPVIVREPALGCEDMLLLDQPNEVEIFTDGMNTNEIVKNAMAIDRTLGIPGRVEFQHKGEAWKLFGSVSFYTGAIKVQQSTDGGNTWSDVPNSSVTPTQSVYNTSVATLDRNATHIRFVRPSGGQGYHYYKDVKVYPAQYLESATTSINYENINVGGTYTKKIYISYSNIKSPIYYIASSSDITVSPKTFGECGKFGTQELTITWKPSTNIGQQTVTFRDSLSEISDLTINLTANIDRRKQEILWENRPEVILSHTGIDNRPIYTIDANSKAPTTLKIEYTVVEGTENAYFSDDMFFILNEGEITIKAANDGNEEYAAIEEVYNLTLQGVPPTFIGGTDNQLWNNENNWKNKLMPSDEYSIANITAPVEINNLLVDINNVRVADNASIHITSTGGLTVGVEGIQCANNDGSAIIIDNLHSGAGFFRISPDCEDELPRITMRYQTKSTLDSGANKDATWQYIGAPGEDASVHVDYNTWLYRLDESQADWVLMPQLNNHTLSPFQGYALTQYGQPTYEWNAQMTNRNCTIPLTYHFDGRKGQNLIANSYTAPIDVTQMLPEHFQMIEGQSEYYDITQTLYLYNSGSWKAWHTQDSLGTGISSDGNNTTPGQYYAIPVLAVAEGYIPERPTIAPMQGIYVRVRAKKTGGDTHVGNIIFDYDRIVMGEGHDMHRPMRAPQTTDQNTSDDLFRRVRIVVNSSNSGSDRLYIIQAHNTTRNYDNGYDAPNQATQGIVNIYTYEPGGKMEVSCANNIDSTYIGFMAGEDRTYTLHFNTIVGETLCLQDLTTGEKINIVEGGTYTFEAEPQSTNNQRFLLLAQQGIKSDIDDIDPASIWYNNRTLYITNAADNSTLQLYDVSGHQIFSTTIHHTPYTVDLTHLNEGVYMARVNNQVYKFVCK